MICHNCGAELTDDTRFCSYCGAKVEETVPEPPQPQARKNDNPQEPIAEPQQNSNAAKPLLAESIIAKVSIFWGGLDVFCKVTTVSIAIVAVLLIVSICAGRGLAILFSVLQLACTIIALLMHKGVIKLGQKLNWLKCLALAFAVLLTALNVASYSWRQSNQPRSAPAYNPAGYPSPDSTPVSSVKTKVTVPCTSENCIGQNYSSLISEFTSAGFTYITTEKVEDLSSADAGQVDDVVSVSIGDKTEFEQGQEFGRDDHIVIRYHVFEKCAVTIHIDFVPNLFFSKYNVKMRVDGMSQGTLEHGEDKDFTLSLEPDEYTLTFESEDSSSVKGEISLQVDCDLEASYSISCYNDKVSVTELYVDRQIELADGDVKLNVSASDYHYEDYKTVTAALKSLGFTNIKYDILYDIFFGWTDEGEVKSVSIAGDNEFARGDVFPKDAEIVITYHMPEEDDPAGSTAAKDSDEGKEPVPVFYSTNDYETAKKGNTGVFSYKSLDSHRRAEGAYDVYWIVDFDEGYVYFFSDGNGDETCDKVKIVSGDLNDKIIITYHYGDDVWSYGLHFKYVNHPETLIMQDDDGFECEYSTTDLSGALSLRNRKTINDMSY